MTPEQLAAMYRDYVNNFLTVETWAEHYGLHVVNAPRLLALGALYHESEVVR